MAFNIYQYIPFNTMWLFYTNRVWLWNRRYMRSWLIFFCFRDWSCHRVGSTDLAWAWNGMAHSWASQNGTLLMILEGSGVPGCPTGKSLLLSDKEAEPAGCWNQNSGHRYKPCSKLIWVSSTSILSAGRLPINHQPSTIHFLMPRSAVIGNSPFALLVHLEGVKHFKASALFGVGQTLLPQAQDSISAA